jgi:hypothetical protein
LKLAAFAALANFSQEIRVLSVSFPVAGLLLVLRGQVHRQSSYE